ncbi:MAG: DUF4340 domain-containing protein [Planctomycetota bacterium]|jgi:hypothetical protein
MSNRKLTILGIVAVFMVLWAAVQSRVSNRPKAESDRPVYLIQGLDPAGIDSIVLGTGEEEVTLKSQGKEFVLVSKDNYPAKTSEINDLISKCLEIKTSGFVTDNPANHEDLEVTEEKARSVVKFFKPDSSPLTGVVVGKSEELGQGTYVRLASNDKVYVAPSVPWFGGQAMNYVEKELVSVKREDVESVTFSSPSGDYTLKTKEDSQDIVLENIPAGKKLKDSDSRSVFTALSNLTFDDVMKKSSDLTFDKQYVCRLKDSTVYTLKIAQKDEKTYIVCEAVYTDKTPITKDSDVESEEELKAKEAKLLARDNAPKFTAKHQAWIYEIPEWKANNLAKELADLIEDEEKPEEKDDAEDPNAIEPDETIAPKTEDPNTPKTEDPNTPKAEDPNTAEADS